MKNNLQKTSDVFLSVPFAESQYAAELSRLLRSQGLEPFDVNELTAGISIEDAIWEALAESQAVIAIIPHDGPSSNMMFEIGAARAWHKPIFGVMRDQSSPSLSPALANVSIYPASRIDDVIRAIKGARELSDDDRSDLASAYADTMVSVDQLILNPTTLDSLVESFRRKTGKSIAGEVLVSELLRMRKQGRLGTLRSRQSARRNTAGKA